MLLTLPDEILLEILKCLATIPHEDGVARGVSFCRCVCKRLSRIGEDVAFETLLVNPDRYGLRPLLALSNSPLRHKVKKFRCYYEVFDPRLATSMEIFATAEHCSEMELEKDFEAYRTGFSRQTSLEQDMLNTPVLALALSRLENLRRIELAQGYEYTWTMQPEGSEFEPRDIIKSPMGHTIFEALVDALSQCQGHIEDLTLGARYDEKYPFTDDPGLVGLIQRLNPVSYPKYQQAFRNLKHLMIALPWSMGEDGTLNYRGLSALITSAQALEALCLTYARESLDPLPFDFLQSLYIPKLSTLALANVTFEYPTHLIAWLYRHVTTLRKLNFSGVTIEEGSWEKAVLMMRAYLKLESCRIARLYVDGFEDICPEEKLHLFYPAVEAFLCRKLDENPFKLLAKSEQDDGSS